MLRVPLLHAVSNVCVQKKLKHLLSITHFAPESPNRCKLVQALDIIDSPVFFGGYFRRAKFKKVRDKILKEGSVLGPRLSPPAIELRTQKLITKLLVTL